MDKKYTFEDWLNDRINYKFLTKNVMNVHNGLYTLYKREGRITEDDYEKIKKHQIKAYDTVVEKSVKSFIIDFQISYDSSPYKNDYINNEIQINEEIIKKDPNELNMVLRGSKNWTCIKGSQYQKIMKKKVFFDKDSGEYKLFLWTNLNNNIRITALHRYLQWLKEFKKQSDSKHQDTPERNNEEKNLSNELRKYGFFDLEMITKLQKDKTGELIEFINQELPYQIAMLDHLGFIKYLEKEHCNTKKELYKLLSDILKTNERSVKGNILVLVEHSKENRNRYTADKNKEKAQKDYQKLI